MSERRQMILATRIGHLDVVVVTMDGKALLGVLAAYADLDGTNCRPGVPWLMAETGWARSKVFAVLKHLRKIGALLSDVTPQEAARRRIAIDFRIAIDHLPGTPRERMVECRGRSPSSYRQDQPSSSQQDQPSSEPADHPGPTGRTSPGPSPRTPPRPLEPGPLTGGENARGRAPPTPSRTPPSESRRKRMRELLVRVELGTAGTAVDDWLTWLEPKGVIGMWDAIESFLRSAKRWAPMQPEMPMPSTRQYHRHLAPHWKAWLKGWNAPAAAKAAGG